MSWIHNAANGLRSPCEPSAASSSRCRRPSVSVSARGQAGHRHPCVGDRAKHARPSFPHHTELHPTAVTGASCALPWVPQVIWRCAEYTGGCARRMQTECQFNTGSSPDYPAGTAQLIPCGHQPATLENLKLYINDSVPYRGKEKTRFKFCCITKGSTVGKPNSKHWPLS